MGNDSSLLRHFVAVAIQIDPNLLQAYQRIKLCPEAGAAKLMLVEVKQVHLPG
jgi:hypothetical protein